MQRPEEDSVPRHYRNDFKTYKGQLSWNVQVLGQYWAGSEVATGISREGKQIAWFQSMMNTYL